MKQYFRNSIRDVRTLLAVDIESNNNIILAEMQIKLKINQKN